MKSIIKLISIVILLTCSSPLLLAGDIVVYDSKTPVSAIVSLDNAHFEKTSSGELAIETTGANDQKRVVYPGIAVKGNWDISEYNVLELEIIHRDNKNSNLPLTIRLGGPNAGLGGENDSYIDKFNLPQRGEFVQSTVIYPVKFKTTGMRKTPWDCFCVSDKLQGNKITSIGVYMGKPLLNWKWSIKKITLKKKDLTDVLQTSKNKSEFPKSFVMPTYYDYCMYGDLNCQNMTEKEFFPFIDVYGQYKHKEWPGKIHSDTDLQKNKTEELKDLEAHPGPKGWNKYGGWSEGPRYKATGQFRVEKINGKWWMIDPEGCLFWSHGPVRVTSSSAVTPLDGREHYFTNLPDQKSPFATFYKTRDELLWPYYEKRNIQKTYDFSSSNAFRKYGKDWRRLYSELAHRRLRSWGMNTVANSSDINICLMNQTPYTDRIELKSPPIEASHDGWWKFRDPFHPEFRANFRRQLEERRSEINNPWCFGFFVDNELTWGNDTSLGEWTLQSPKTQKAKIEFIKRLKEKYKTVDELNTNWKSQYTSWQALLESTAVPPTLAKSDCGEFADAIVDSYYRIIREEFKRAAPDKLYLGCRFAGASPNQKFLRIGAKYCDVLSFNIYSTTLENFKLPEGVDLPVIVGEFHFGALDRGMFHWTLIGVANQKERGQAYYNYVRSALLHPNFIGVHWHQYGEQPTTGRFDGENFQNGFLDVCDTPYPEIIEKIREIGYQMYTLRKNGK